MNIFINCFIFVFLFFHIQSLLCSMRQNHTYIIFIASLSLSLYLIRSCSWNSHSIWFVLTFCSLIIFHICSCFFLLRTVLGYVILFPFAWVLYTAQASAIPPS